MHFFFHPQRMFSIVYIPLNVCLNAKQKYKIFIQFEMKKKKRIKILMTITHHIITPKHKYMHSFIENIVYEKRIG